jgi:hypothetical protein
MQPSTTDFIPPFDPTGYANITGAQLKQFVTGLIPSLQEGLALVTTDIANVAQVPAANVTTKWQSYIWIRLTNVATAVVYVWIPAASSDPTYLNWVSIQQVTLPVNSVGTAQLQALAVTDAKVNDVSWGKITGTPVFMEVSPTPTVAGGALAGNYPSPTIAANAVTGGAGGSVAQNTLTNYNLAKTGGTPTTPNTPTLNAPVDPGTNIIIPSGSNAGDIMTVNTGINGYTTETVAIVNVTNPTTGNNGQILQVLAGAWTYIFKSILQLVEPTGGQANYVIQVNGAGNGYQLVTAASLLAYTKSNSGNIAAINGTGSVSYQFAHGLLATPTKVRVVAVQTNASSQNSYAQYDEVDITQILSINSYVQPAFTTCANPTNVVVSQGASGTGALYVVPKGGGAVAAMTSLGTWFIKVYAEL